MDLSVQVIYNDNTLISRHSQQFPRERHADEPRTSCD
jgi:hypothetical protein